MKYSTKKILTLVIMTIVALVLWFTPVLYPFKILVVFIHEICHALAAIITAWDLNAVDRIIIHTNESGMAQIRDGIFFITASAGYVGTSIVGGLLLYTSTDPSKSRNIYLTLGSVLITMTLIYVRPIFGFGYFFGFIVGLGFLFLYFKQNRIVVYFAQFLAVMCCLYVFYDFADYFDIHRTDAGILAHYFGLPFLAYPIAIVWTVISLFILFWGFKKSIQHDEH